jgi:hypothetical protein
MVTKLTKLERIKADGKFLHTPDMSDPSTITEHVFKKYNEKDETIHGAKPGEVYFSAFCQPVDTKDEWIRVLEYRKGLKQQYDSSMSLVYTLSNEIARGEK